MVDYAIATFNQQAALVAMLYLRPHSPANIVAILHADSPKCRFCIRKATAAQDVRLEITRPTIYAWIAEKHLLGCKPPIERIAEVVAAAQSYGTAFT